MTRKLVRWVGIAGGPLLIVVIGLFLRRDFVFHPVVYERDMAQFWLPLHCFMGSSLRAGHIPAWNPHTFSGLPFAADPQGGWLNLLPMLLFTTLSCGRAIRWLVVIQPIIAGVALYWFLREEDVSRPAAAIGGLVLCGALAASKASISIRFPGALAWTGVLLASTSRYMRAERGSSRIGWLVAGAVAWGQIAANHLGVGLLIGTAAWVGLIGVKLAGEARSDEGRARRIALTLLPVLPAFAAVNVAWFMPRLALLPDLSLGMGYGSLRLLSLKLIQFPTPAFPGEASGASWLIDLSTTPGRYLGGAALLTSFAGLCSRRHRALAVVFCLFGSLSYLGSLGVVVQNVPRSLRRIPLVDGWLHAPHWTSLGVLLAIAVLGALGVDAWRESSSPIRRSAMIAPGIALWGLFPLFLGVPPARVLLLGAAGGLALILLAVSVDRPFVAVAVPILVGAELVVGPFLWTGEGFAEERVSGLLFNQIQVSVPLADYLRPPEIVSALQGGDTGRFMPILTQRDPRSLSHNEPLTFGLESTGGYQSVQLRRYWILVRRLDPDARARYQYATFKDPPPTLLDLLAVNWFVAGRDTQVEVGASPVARSGEWTLYRRAGTVRRASLFFDWQVVKDPGAALEAVAEPGFRPDTRVVLESPLGPTGPFSAPSAGQGEAVGEVTYTSLGPQAASIRVRSSRPAILLVRDVLDDNWHATLDGESIPVLRADYLLQAVAVPEGTHTVVLKYDDPMIGLGLAGSAVALGGLAVLAVILRRREGATTTPGSAPQAGPLSSASPPRTAPSESPQ